MFRVYKRRRQTNTTKEGDEENNHEKTRGDDRIPLDLIVEVLKKLPAKSLVRFRSVSKEWSNIIGSRRDFIESIVTRSLADKLPLFIFHHSGYGHESFFTVSSIFSQSIKHAVSLPTIYDGYSFEYKYARGLICCYSVLSHLVNIYNPTTRQSFPLPKIESPLVIRYHMNYCHFGYDPVMNQYKVLFIILDYEELKQSIYVFTLGGSQSWRKIQGIDEKLYPQDLGVCIDGTIYYVATRVATRVMELGNKCGETVLLSFDIRSERFDHVWAPELMLKAFSSNDLNRRTLVNHLGKLGYLGSSNTETNLWILENAEKQELSKITFGLPDCDPFLGHGLISSGVTPAGEIFVAERRYDFDKSVYVYYYDRKQNSYRKVEIQGTSPDNIKSPADGPVFVFPIHDHVENTMWL